jgi:hypothetical protein
VLLCCSSTSFDIFLCLLAVAARMHTALNSVLVSNANLRERLVRQLGFAIQVKSGGPPAWLGCGWPGGPHCRSASNLSHCFQLCSSCRQPQQPDPSILLPLVHVPSSAACVLPTPILLPFLAAHPALPLLPPQDIRMSPDNLKAYIQWDSCLGHHTILEQELQYQ